MIKVEAVVVRDRVETVMDAVEEQTGHVGVTVIEAVGHGRQRGITHEYRGRIFESRFLPKAYLFFLVQDELAPGVVEAIADAARTGHESGDGLVWTPPNGMRFDVVHALLDVVPDARHGAFIGHLLDATVAPGGRLLLSWYNASDDPAHTPAARIRALGWEVGGETRVPDRPGRSDGVASAWIDKT